MAEREGYPSAHHFPLRLSSQNGELRGRGGGVSVLFTLRRVGCRPPPGLAHSSEQGCVNLDQSILLGRGIPNQPILVFGEIIRVNPFLRRGEGPNWGVELSGGCRPWSSFCRGNEMGGGRFRLYPLSGGTSDCGSSIWRGFRKMRTCPPPPTHTLSRSRSLGMMALREWAGFPWGRRAHLLLGPGR